MFFKQLLQGRQVITQRGGFHLLNAFFREGQPAGELLQLLLLQSHQHIVQPGQGDTALVPPGGAEAPTPGTRKVGARESEHTLV